jgi:hypothetical protein
MMITIPKVGSVFIQEPEANTGEILGLASEVINGYNGQIPQEFFQVLNSKELDRLYEAIILLTIRDGELEIL